MCEEPVEWVYNRPKYGWVCFFCGEVFRTPGAAADHFGGEMGSTAACKIKAGSELGLVMALRKAEEEILKLREMIENESFEAIQQLRKHMYECAEKERRAEEKGYARGVRDMKEQGYCVEPAKHNS